MAVTAVVSPSPSVTAIAPVTAPVNPVGVPSTGAATTGSALTEPAGTVTVTCLVSGLSTPAQLRALKRWWTIVPNTACRCQGFWVSETEAVKVSVPPVWAKVASGV
jgi:hypothetical protein